MKTKIKLFSILFIASMAFTSCSDDDGPGSAPLGINTISPNIGVAGTQATISGEGFSEMTADNSVQFNGATATVNSATATQLQVTVPDGATTGVVSVSVNGNTEQGPIFTVDNRLNFIGDYENEEDYDLDGVSIPPGDQATLIITGDSEIEIELSNDNMNEMILDLTDFLETGLSEIAIGGSVTFDFDDDIIATIDGDGFEIEPSNFTIIDNSGGDSFPAVLEGGTGELDNGTLLLSLKYAFYNDSSQTDGARYSVDEVEFELD